MIFQAFVVALLSSEHNFSENTDKTAKSGTTYLYTVRCLSSDGKSLTSYYNTSGKPIQL